MESVAVERRLQLLQFGKLFVGERRLRLPELLRELRGGSFDLDLERDLDVDLAFVAASDCSTARGWLERLKERVALRLRLRERERFFSRDTLRGGVLARLCDPVERLERRDGCSFSIAAESPALSPAVPWSSKFVGVPVSTS